MNNITQQYQFLSGLDWLFTEDSDRPYFWVAGGALSSLISGRRVSDWDIFSRDPKTVVSWFKKQKGRVTFSNNFVTNIQYKGEKIQVIHQYVFNDMTATISAFDFTIVCGAFDGKEFVHHERFFIDNAQHRLVINTTLKPLNTVKRMLKYASRGYQVCPVGLASVLKTINTSSINWDDPDENIIDFYPDGTPTFRGVD